MAEVSFSSCYFTPVLGHLSLKLGEAEKLTGRRYVDRHGLRAGWHRTLRAEQALSVKQPLRFVLYTLYAE